jgi:CP family cyanate transporter-like MFS transporter
MALLTAGVVVRVVAGQSTVLVGTLIACGGIAICNVLIPVVVRESYPHRLALLTSLYTAALQTAAALGSVLTPPVDTAFGGWRPGLGQWALLAAVGTLGWFVAARPADRPAMPSGTVRTADTGPRRSLWRSPLAWQVTGFFGFQSMFAYIVMGWAPQVLMSGGIPRGEAGAMVAVMGILGVPASLLIAPIALRRRAQSGWLVVLTALGIVGVFGLLVAPGAAPWLWSILIGLSMGVFAIALGVISLRSTTSADTGALSTMSQSVGYLLGAVGPLVFGILHGATGSWAASLLVMLAGLGVQVVFGYLAGRPRYV